MVLGGADSASAAGPQLSSFTGLPATATVPPLPPGPPSGVFTPFSPSEQAAAAPAWAATLQTRDPAYGNTGRHCLQGYWRLLVPIRRYPVSRKVTRSTALICRDPVPHGYVTEGIAALSARICRCQHM